MIIQGIPQSIGVVAKFFAENVEAGLSVKQASQRPDTFIRAGDAIMQQNMGK